MNNYIQYNGKLIQVKDELGNATPECKQLMIDNLYKMYELKTEVNMKKNMNV